MKISIKSTLLLCSSFVISELSSGGLIFEDDFNGVAGESLNTYNSNYTISTSNTGTWSEGIGAGGNGASFSNTKINTANGLVTAVNSADYTATSYADSRYLYASANFFVADAAEFIDDDSKLYVEIDFTPHQDLRFGIRKDGGNLYSYAEFSGRAVSNIALYTPGENVIVGIKYDGESSSWATRPVFGVMNPGLTEPVSWGAELSDQSNSNAAHSTSGVVLGVSWPNSYGGDNPSGVAGTINNIKIGTTYSDVAQVAIPEPSSLLLIGIAVSGFYAFRRRR